MYRYTLLFCLALPAMHDALAQEANPFEPPPQVLRDSFSIALGGSNRLLVELSDLGDLTALQPSAALLREAAAELEPLRDSLADPLQVKSIDLLTDTAGRRMLRLDSRLPAKDHFLLGDEGLAALKVDQDTIRILHVRREGPGSGGLHYIRWTFLLNDYSELASLGGPRLDSALALLAREARRQTKWSSARNGKLRLSAGYALDTGSGQRRVKIVDRYHYGDFVSPDIQGNLQNAGGDLSPSLSLGLRFVFPREDLTRELRLDWEPQFLFDRGDKGALQACRNDWLSVTFSQYKTGAPAKRLAFTGNLSLAYLLRRKGDFFDKGSLRLGLGGLKMDKLGLEPIIYFHDLFRGVSPGIRLSVSF